MKRFLKRILATWAIGLIGFGCTGVQAEEPRSDFERAFIGQEWSMAAYIEHSAELTRHCKYESGDTSWNQKPMPDYVLTYLDCHGDGRWLMLLNAVTGVDERSYMTVKVLDALLLPKPKPGERYEISGMCEDVGNTRSRFIVITSRRFGKRNMLDWKTGVRLAWLPNMETGKIEPLSTRHIVCWRPTPP